MSERDIQNNAFGTYTTNNYFLQYCGMKQPIQFATKQPNIFFKGGYGPGGAGGCVIGIITIFLRFTAVTTFVFRLVVFHLARP